MPRGTNENTPDEERYFQLFGDPAYGVSAHIQSPFGGERTVEQKHWNLLMSRARIVIENRFAIVSNHWPYLNAGWKMQLGSSPVGRYYRTAVLLTNGMSCLCPNQVSLYFDCEPPELDEYFHH
jgi:nuclease HARBI1